MFLTFLYYWGLNFHIVHLTVKLVIDECIFFSPSLSVWKKTSLTGWNLHFLAPVGCRCMREMKQQLSRAPGACNVHPDGMGQLSAGTSAHSYCAADHWRCAFFPGITINWNHVGFFSSEWTYVQRLNNHPERGADIMKRFLLLYICQKKCALLLPRLVAWCDSKCEI